MAVNGKCGSLDKGCLIARKYTLIVIYLAYNQNQPQFVTRLHQLRLLLRQQTIIISNIQRNYRLLCLGVLFVSDL